MRTLCAGCNMYGYIYKRSGIRVISKMYGTDCHRLGLFMFSSLGGREWEKVLVASEGEVHNLC